MELMEISFLSLKLNSFLSKLGFKIGKDIKNPIEISFQMKYDMTWVSSYFRLNSAFYLILLLLFFQLKT